MYDIEIFILFIVSFIIIFFIILRYSHSNNIVDATEDFTAIQSNDKLKGADPNPVNETVKPINKNNESVIYDNKTQSIMTGSEFMKNTGVAGSQWIAPAWNPSSFSPSKINVEDYENDPRMLYNKCSLSCCTSQYPTPFQGTADPNICKKIKDKKYFASNYVCENTMGGSGCLCMTQKQIDGLQNGFTED